MNYIELLIRLFYNVIKPLLPNFRGKARIKNIFDKLSSIFINSDGCFSADQLLGNK